MDFRGWIPPEILFLGAFFVCGVIYILYRIAAAIAPHVSIAFH